MESNTDGELVNTVGRENPPEEGTLLKGIFHFKVEIACLILSGISVGYILGNICKSVFGTFKALSLSLICEMLNSCIGLTLAILLLSPAVCGIPFTYK